MLHEKLNIQEIQEETLTMLGHVSIRVQDLEASVKFYLSVLSPLSYELMRFPSVVGLGPTVKTPSAPIPDLWLRQYEPEARNNYSEKPTPVHISFYAKEPKQVDEFHARGLEAGGKDNGKPGERPFLAGYYGRRFQWPDFNFSFWNVCDASMGSVKQWSADHFEMKSGVYFGLGWE